MKWNSENKVVYGPRSAYSQNKPRGLVFFLCAFTALLAVIFYGAYWVAAHPKFTIKNISITGIANISEEKLRSAIAEYLNTEILFGLSRKQYFFASGRALEKLILEKFPRIKKAKVKVVLPDKLTASIEERAIWGTLCDYIAKANASTTAQTTKITNCSYIDADGFAFETAPEFYGFLTKKIYTEKTINIGSQTVRQESLVFYDAMQAVFASLAVPLTHIEFPADLPRDARLYSGKWFVIVSRDADAQKLADILRPLLETELKSNLHRLQYIDMRFGNKVFYKFNTDKSKTY